MGPPDLCCCCCCCCCCFRSAARKTSSWPCSTQTSSSGPAACALGVQASHTHPTPPSLSRLQDAILPQYLHLVAPGALAPCVRRGFRPIPRRLCDAAHPPWPQQAAGLPHQEHSLLLRGLSTEGITGVTSDECASVFPTHLGQALRTGRWFAFRTNGSISAPACNQTRPSAHG
jgi:hypothetical protein